MTAPVLPIDAPDRHVLDAPTGGTEAAGCAACPHPLAHHDAIGRRFCAATTAGATVRGCICRP
jgi:hypothetical protein